jgi:hypothetical protein
MGVAEETPQLLGEEIREDFMVNSFTPPWRMCNIVGKEVESVSNQVPHEDLNALLSVVIAARRCRITCTGGTKLLGGLRMLCESKLVCNNIIHITNTTHVDTNLKEKNQRHMRR